MTARIAVVLVLLGAVCAPSARAELTWSAPQSVSTNETNGSHPSVGVAPDGSAVVAWDEVENGIYRIHVATRTRRGFLGPSQVLSPANRQASGAKVVVARDGTALVAWTQARDSGTSGIVTAVRKPGGDFGTPAFATTDPKSESLRTVAMDAGGNTILTYQRDAAPKGVDFMDIVRKADGTFLGPHQLMDAAELTQNVSGKAILYGTDVAFAPNGSALIAWSDNPNATNGDLSATEIRVQQYYAGNGTYSATQVVAPRNTSRNISSPQAFVSATRTGVAYTRYDNSGVSQAEVIYRAGVSGPFTGLQTVGSPGSSWGTVEPDPSGGAVATLFRDPPAAPAISEIYFPPDKTDFNGSKPLPAGVQGTASEFADSGSGVAEWSDDTNIFVAERAAGTEPTYGAPVDLGVYDYDRDLDVGPDGTAATAYEVLDQGNTHVVVRFGDLPAPPEPPTATPTPTPTPPPPPEPPVPSAIQIANKPGPGEATVMTVNVTGAATRVEWTVGNQKPRAGGVVNGVLQRSLRTHLDGPTDVSVKVSGPGGDRTFKRSLAGPRDATDAAAKEIRGGRPPNDDPVLATGTEDVLTGKASGCGPVNVYAGSLAVSGCMRTIRGIDDIPSGERGVLDALNIAYGLLTKDAKLLNRVTELKDGYAISGTALLNGRWPVNPASGAGLVVYPEAGVLTSSNASVRVAGQPLKSIFSGFRLQLSTRSGTVDLGLVDRPSGFPRLGGFPYQGDFSVSLGPSVATIETDLKLPDFAQRNGINVQPRITLTASPDGLAGSAPASIGPMDLSFGLIDVKDLRATYEPSSGQWVGGMRACLFGPGCLDFRPPNGAIRLQNNDLVYARTGQTFGSPGTPLSPGVFLESINAGFGLNPSRIFGGGRVGVGSVLKLDGNEVFAFPSARAPYTLQRSEVGNGFPASSYATQFTRPLIAAGADVSLALPVLGETKLANGYMLYEAPGYVSVGGGAGVNVLGIFSVNGAIGGEYNLANQRSNLHGDTSACLIAVDDDLCVRSVVNMSRGRGLEGGAGACATVGPVSVGGGVLWASPGTPIIWPLDGCKWSPFKLDVRTRASGPITSLTVKVGKTARAIRFDGAGDSPLVRVTGPQTLEPGDQRLAYTPDGNVRIVRADAGDAHFTTVGLQAKGTWKIEVLPGSAAVTRSSQAQDPAEAKVSGRVVRGRGDKRVLRYVVRKRPAQSVSFYDVSASGARKLIGTTPGGRGKLTFTPAPDRARHKVVAAFTLDSIAAEERDVTTFQPPAPELPTPKRVRVRRTGTTVRVTWRGVRGAARYELALTAGRQRFLTTRKRSATFTKVAKTAGGAVTVRAAASLRQSPVARVRLKRAAKPKPKLGGLKKCKVKKKKVRCR